MGRHVTTDTDAQGRTVVKVGPDATEQDRRSKVSEAGKSGATQSVKLDAVLANQEAILAELRGQ